MSFEKFQDGHHGGHLGYWNGMILAILNLHVATMPPKFQLNPTYGSGGDVENVKSQRRTDEDGWTMDNRPLHKLTWSKAPGELITEDNILYIPVVVSENCW